MDEVVAFIKEPTYKIQLSKYRRRQWQKEMLWTYKQKRESKIRANRRSNVGKPISWPLELYTIDIPASKVELIPEPNPAQPDPNRIVDVPQHTPLVRFKELLKKAPTRLQQPQERYKAIMTEVTTVVGDDESVDKMDEEIYERIEDDDNLPPKPALDLHKIEEDRQSRKQAKRLSDDDDSYLRDQVFDSCALQGDTGLGAALGKFFPWMTDAGNGQAVHVFWHGKEICPQILDHWESPEYRAEKLFVPVDRSNATFMEVIRLVKELDTVAAERKRAISGYYCCFALFYGQKPRQSAHIDHTILRYDLDKRIITKPRYDHAEDFKHNNSVNTVKKIVGFTKEQAEGLDDVDGYLHAWKRLAGKNRWWFKDQCTGREWIAVPCLWKHTEPTESSYLKHFGRCFAKEHYSIYCERPQPDFKQLDPKTVLDIKASVLARKSACLHTKERSFQEVVKAIWQVLFKQTPNDAREQHDRAIEALVELEKKRNDVFACELSIEICEKTEMLVDFCK